MRTELRWKIALAIFTVCAPVAISLFMGHMQAQTLQAVMREKIASLERDTARHELEKGKDISRLSASAEDHGQRIIRLEANIDSIQATLSEVREDIKLLLRGMEKK